MRIFLFIIQLFPTKVVSGKLKSVGDNADW